MRAAFTLFALLFGFSLFYQVFGPIYREASYKISPKAETLLSPKVDSFGKKLSFDTKEQAYQYNSGYTPVGPEAKGLSSTPKFTSKLYDDPTKGEEVTDPVSNISVTFKPKFGLDNPKKDANRLIYPISNMNAEKVVSLKATKLKEDIILNHYQGDTAQFDYEIVLPDGLEARAESDGSVGIYGVDSKLLGNVSTGNDKDAQLLKNARLNGKKTQLIFTIPVPFVKEFGKSVSKTKAWMTTKGNILSIHASGLQNASYPLTIDPSIYINSAVEFMQGNNETNVDFDVDNGLIKKSNTTGARFNSWTCTKDINIPVWDNGMVTAGGYVYSVGGQEIYKNNYSCPGNANFVVPTGVTSITVKMWGAGGSGGGGGSSGTGGAGGGGAYVSGVLTVTAGETLSVSVGGAGGVGVADTTNNVGDGGGGGGRSTLYRSSTPLAIAGAGAGGGGGRSGSNGAAGGAGGGTNGVTGTASGAAGAGVRGTSSGAGAGGTGGTTSGATGVNEAGGAGGITTSGPSGGTGSGGAGGNASTNRSGGGGGGAGYWGGGGGSGSSNSTGGAGGGGGSGYIDAGATSPSNTAGSGTTPGNSGDADIGGAGTGGAGGAAATNGTAGTNGRVVISYTISGNSTNTSSTVSWAQFNTSTKTIDSPNPGAGTCANWCTNSAYDLPAARKGFSMVAYNGYLYVLGGLNGAGTRQTTVYIAKLGANGEPQLWHPTDTDKTHWLYWFTDTALSTERSYSSAVAYNNRIYLLGGQTNASTGGVTTALYANINPIGTLGAWTATTALPSARFGHSTVVYNDRIYLIGGNSGGTLQNSTYYTKMNSDGTLNSWWATSSFSTARMSWGGNMATIWGAYIYIAGGCTAVNGSGYCTTIASDVQLASINADGTLDTWDTNASVNTSLIGYNLLSWRNDLYEVGGCSAQNTGTGVCTTAVNDTDYGAINQDGDASTVNSSVASGVAPCSGGSPVSCDLPGTTYIGNFLNVTAILNGYLYIIGGCTNVGCTTTSTNVAYLAIGSDGSLNKPGSCPGGTYRDSFCVDSTNTISGGVAAAGSAIFNNRMYIVGGLDGSGTKTGLYFNTFNTDGSLAGAWTTQTMSSVGITTNVSYNFVYARASPSTASTFPGNLYVLGGCGTNSGGDGCGSSDYRTEVWKCFILPAGSIDTTVATHTPCTTTGQLQIDSEPGTGGNQGLGAMAGSVYAGYIYLIGGLTPNLTDIKTVRYAKFDNSNNIVTVSSSWVEMTNQMSVGRRRGSAFVYNGYLYVVGGYDASTGILADIEFSKINVSDGTIGTFTVSAVTIQERWGLSLPVSNSYAYVIGGCIDGNSPTCNTGGSTNNIQTFQVYNNDAGSPAAYSAGNTTGVDRIGGSATVSNGYIYYAGGCTNIGCTAFTNTTYYAALDAQGLIGTWAAGGNLPASVAWGKLVASGGTLYYVGGQTGNATTTAVSTVYYTSSFSTGNPTWNGSAASNGIPAARTQMGVTVWNNRIYVVGGYSSAGTVQATVYASPSQASGGNITSAWPAATTSFSVARAGLTAISYANNLYIFGGNDGTNYFADTQYSQIAAAGTVGSWTFSTSLPTNLSDADGFAYNGYVYLFGGRSAASTYRNSTLVAPISANTTIASGNNPTGVAEWYQTNQAFTATRYGLAAAYYDGKAYVLGGGNSAFVAAGDRTYYTSLLSQPQVAKYSRMIDTDLDVTPSYWVMNGLDNSTGAEWYMKYRSSTSATGSWGQETSYGIITLGDVASYTPKDSGGSNTSVARYYYMNVYIDASQSFGYPDDVSRGPTITDLSLFYTSNPSRRLRHGKTFSGGLQQPLDTPCGQSVDAQCPHP